jgi:hypothetical protein
MAMETTIFHLIGRPGVGKYTVGTELARRTGARLVDNHSIANVLFNLLDQDGVKPLPDGIWPLVGQVRATVIETLLRVSPRHLSFVFTNYMRGEDEAEYAVFLEMVAVAEARASLFVPVILSCETPELVTRIVQDDRRARMKLVDPVLGAHFNDDVPQFTSDHPNTLELDVTHTRPDAAARAIIDWRDEIAGR